MIASQGLSCPGIAHLPICGYRARRVPLPGRLAWCVAVSLPGQRAGILNHNYPRLPPYPLLQAYQLLGHGCGSYFCRAVIPFFALSRHLMLYLNYFPGSGVFYPVIKACVFGTEAKSGLLDDVSVSSRNEGDSGSTLGQAGRLIFCAAGLQVRILPLCTQE